ncbi:MAG: helicase-related protein [Myxococcota bacterium]
MSARRTDPRPASVVALLGPTNTGKTHRAIDRMLSWPSGIMGLPLRLLAREVYDRVRERIGERRVALITGEEKRVPREAVYFICTVEAMPTDRRVAFVAVDEIQLAGDRNRGHTFTDRLLNVRGTEQTMFLGADTIAPLMKKLVPKVEIESAHRLSRLSWAGTKKIASIPPRSAIVAFSAEKVYEVAERLKALHGGAAVVLGALSPRTRNAQVEMFQAGEVQHMVATDAIGMGLNMDLQHVWFTDVRKYDGRGFRALSASEVAQIAGRAGRYKTDGTFGATRALGPLDPDLIEAVEAHRFPALTRLFWRNSKLDFRTPEALLRSLSRPPPASGLLSAFGEDDQRTLEALVHRDDVRDCITEEAAVRTLWEVCRIPDYRKTHTGSHAELLERIVIQLVERGEIDEEFVGSRLRRLDRTDGDIETLMARIAWVRTWTYVAWQSRWTADPQRWQAETRRLEDSLSDALHERLTARFVDRRVSFVMAGGAELHADVRVDEGTVRIGAIELGRLVGWTFVPTSELPKVVARAVRGRLRVLALARHRAILEADDASITVDDEGAILHEGVAMADLRPGPSVLEPKVVVRRIEVLDPQERQRLGTRLDRWLKAWLSDLFGTLDEVQDLSPAARGLVHMVRTGLGVVPVADVGANLDQLTPADRKGLARLDVRIGRLHVFVKRLLFGGELEARGRLLSLAEGRKPFPSPPADGRATVPLDGTFNAWLEGLGFVGVGPLAVRVDLLEKVSAEARRRTRHRRSSALDPLPSWLGTSIDETLAVLRALGFGVQLFKDGTISVRGKKRRRGA